jgi:DNA-binding transcriptional regulator YiaG
MDAADEAVNDDGADASSRMMPRGYWKKWLHCRTTFTMPAAVALANAVHRELPAPKPKPAALTGEDVRRLREAQGMTQGALAEALGVTQQFISSVERGRRSLNARQQKRLRSLQPTVV